jgi:hypothetical protein
VPVNLPPGVNVMGLLCKTAKRALEHVILLGLSVVAQ